MRPLVSGSAGQEPATGLRRNAWLVHRPQPQALLRLFCFSHAGGQPSAFLPWQRAFGPEIEVCAIQLPGRGQRLHEPACREFEPLLEQLRHALGGLDDLPCAFYGHSLGALVAFELARRAGRGEPRPARVFVSGCSAPPQRQPPRRLHELDDAGLLAAIADYGGTPTDVLADRELMALLLPALRADFALVCDYVYRPGPRLAVPLTVLAGRSDPVVPLDTLPAWHDESSGPVEIEHFDGDHFFPATQADAVVACLRARLAPLCRLAAQMA